MFENTVVKPRRSSAFAASVAAHTVLAGVVAARTLFAFAEPPEPDGFVRIPEYVPVKQDEPIRVEIDPPETRRPQRAPAGGGTPLLAQTSSEAHASPPNVTYQPDGIPAEVGPNEPEGEPGPPGSADAGPSTVGPEIGIGGGPEKGRGGPISARTVGVTPPVVVSSPDPLYPNAARVARLQGTVRLEAIIGPDGAVRDVRVVTGAHPLLDRSAVDAVLKWRYRPATIGERPVSVYLDVIVKFSLV